MAIRIHATRALVLIVWPDGRKEVPRLPNRNLFYWRGAFSTARRSKLHYAFTSGTFGTMPRRGGPSSPPGGLRLGEERRLALPRRGTGSYSGRGLTGPSG